MMNETKIITVKDTSYHSTLSEFLEVARLLEFEVGYEREYDCGDRKGKELLLFNRQEGIIIYLDTAIFSGEALVNAATMYMEVKVPKTVSRAHVEFINRCACTVKKNDTFQMRIECRQSLSDIWANLLTLFETNVKWEELPWMCLLNETEVKEMPSNPEDGILFRQITSNDKIFNADPALKAIVGYK